MKILIGKVISTKMQKTATVAVDRTLLHPVYKKRMVVTKKYHIHDEIGAKVGDVVKFVSSAPVSKTKKWRLTEIVKK